MVKNPPANAGDTGSVLVWEDALEKEMATHFPRTEESGRLQSIGLQKVRYYLATEQQQLRIHAVCSVMLDSVLTLCGVARQAPLSMGLSRQEYWSGFPFPPPGDLPDPGMKPESPASPALAGGIFF